MDMGPVPQNDIFVNDSAYRAHRLGALVSLVGPSSAVKYVGSLVTKDNNATGSGWSSFTIEPVTGNLVPVDLSGTFTATIIPGRQYVPGPGKATLAPFPLQSGATPGPQENQSQSATPQVATPQAGNATGTPTPGTGTGATPTTKATPGLTALLCSGLPDTGRGGR